MNYAIFLDKIQRYESDTFSGSAELITNEEKIKMGDKLLDVFFGEIDGVVLSAILDEVRQ